MRDRLLRRPRPAKFVDFKFRTRALKTLSVVLSISLVVAGAYISVLLSDGFGPAVGLAIVGTAIVIIIQHFVSEYLAGLDRYGEGAMQTFADNLPQAVDKIIRFMASDMTQADAVQLRKDLTSATSAMVAGPRRSRVCVYRVDRRDVEVGTDNRYLAKVHSDGRSDPARDEFTSSEPHGAAVINAVHRNGQIPVQNIQKPPQELKEIDGSVLKKYQSFILTPIVRDGKTWGAVMVDYEGTNHLTKLDGVISSAIARIFEVSFSVIKQGGEDLTTAERSDLLSELRRGLQRGGAYRG